MVLPFDSVTAPWYCHSTFVGHKTVLVVCFQVVAVALTAEKSMETLIGSELTFRCNKDLIVSILINVCKNVNDLFIIFILV